MSLPEAKMHPITLQFSGELENEYHNEVVHKSMKYVRIALFLAFLLNSVFGIMDKNMLTPNQRSKVLFIRYAIISPLLIFALLFSFSAFFKRYMQPILSFYIVVVGLGLLAMSASISFPLSFAYCSSLFIVIIYTFTFPRLRFIYASIASWLLLATTWVGAKYYIDSSLTNAGYDAFLGLFSNLIYANIFGMFAAYSIEYYIRKNFLQKKIIEFRTQEVEQKNQELIRKNQELNESREELLLSVKRSEMIFSALSEALPGTVLDDKYRLDEKIGSGGFGTVYRAQHLLLRHPVAVKIFKPSTGTNPLKNIERFRLEGISACRIQHPNAVSVLDFGVSAKAIAYMVMELLEGPSLQDELLKRKYPSIARCVDILIPICSVLAEAHSRGIIHRDIKPSNILLHRSKEGEVVKVVDFGIAKLMTDTLSPDLQHLTDTGTFLGTPVYMSPERLSNKPYDGKSDVYSLGIMMYEMLCGTLPFRPSKDNHYAVALMHLRQKPTSPRAINPNIPEGLEAIMLRTLEKDPQKRPTAKELGELLQEYASVENDQPVAETALLYSPNFPTKGGNFEQTLEAEKNSMILRQSETQQSSYATTVLEEDLPPTSPTIPVYSDKITRKEEELSSSEEREEFSGEKPAGIGKPGR